jgi:TonB family protein
MRVILALAAILAAFIGTPMAQPVPEYLPPRLAAGGPPELPPPNNVAYGQVMLEAAVSQRGEVLATRTLQHTPGFTVLLEEAVTRWTFSPAQVKGTPAASTALIAAVFRPPSVYPGAAGEPPTPALEPSPETPAAIFVTPPVYPVTARDSGAVIVEALVDEVGRVSASAVRVSSPSFDGAAIDAAKQWRFRPALRGGVPTTSLAYLVFVFRQPVIP